MRDLASTVILLGALQAAVLAPVLWARRENQLANRILATLVAAVALMLLFGELGARFGIDGHPHLLGLGAPLPFLFGPLLYLYVIALTRPVLRFDPRWVVHALPFAADLLYMAQTFYLKGGDEKLALARAADEGHAPLSFYFVGVLGVAQALVYLFLGWRALERYGKKMHGYFSDLARIDLRWLRALVIAHVAVWSVVGIAAVLRLVGHGSGSLAGAVQLGSAFAIFLTGYVSLWQPELAEKATAARLTEAPTPIPAPEPQPERPAPAPKHQPKYQRNRLEREEAEELVTRLGVLMAERQLYKESGLTLPALADALGVTPHTLSQVLNVHVGQSFFAFVNAHRAEALKQALADASTAGRGVLELGFEVGFSSKSTLNSFFKKHTGMTPTEFRGHVRPPKTQQKSRS